MGGSQMMRYFAFRYVGLGLSGSEHCLSSRGLSSILSTSTMAHVCNSRCRRIQYAFCPPGAPDRKAVHRHLSRQNTQINKIRKVLQTRYMVF